MFQSIPNSQLKRQFERLAERQPKTVDPQGKRMSAVLIPILVGQRPRLLYTLRSKHLKHHAGQYSFPGGVIESGESPWQAALREAHEEVGLAPEKVTYVGQIDDVFSPRGFHIRCFVGLVDSFEARLNPAEVEALIEVDLDDVLDDTRHELKPWNGYDVHFFNFEEGLVWGVTGRMTHHLKTTLRSE